MAGSLFDDDLLDSVPFDEPPAKAPSKAKAERLANSLPARTGLDWPPPKERRGMDPRLCEGLAVLKAKARGDDSDELAWCICALVWHLQLFELERVAEVVEELLRPRAGYSTVRDLSQGVPSEPVQPDRAGET